MPKPRPCLPFIKGHPLCCSPSFLSEKNIVVRLIYPVHWWVAGGSKTKSTEHIPAGERKFANSPDHKGGTSGRVRRPSPTRRAWRDDHCSYATSFILNQGLSPVPPLQKKNSRIKLSGMQRH